jgi:hypothetical protein
MEQEHRETLQWFGEQQFEEKRSLRTREEALFNWSMSLFFAGLGALTSLKGFSGAGWSAVWRLLVDLGVLSLIIAVLVMAFLIHRDVERNRKALSRTLSELSPTAPPRVLPDSAEVRMDDEIFFYVRWGAFVLLGAITLGLVWLLG